jgi:hypothetical protein
MWRWDGQPLANRRNPATFRGPLAPGYFLRDWFSRNRGVFGLLKVRVGELHVGRTSKSVQFSGTDSEIRPTGWHTLCLPSLYAGEPGGFLVAAEAGGGAEAGYTVGAGGGGEAAGFLGVEAFEEAG